MLEQERESTPFPESSELNFDKLFDRNGMPILPALIKNAVTGKDLGCVFINKEAYEKTRELGEVVAWTRERAELWHKGETSGNRMIVKGIVKDCDSDTIKIYVDPLGPFCHRGTESCFDEL